ncbi:AAA family ATPase [Sporolactobacillus sp. CPB3-1]|uniref:AAA family ATPase n=1 Tax=Sporolactobacillus mangiferae TaxID=2940498 RepID=A0ABT0M780_9BACL|nr:AAA family ATPase [Sporolactobacillus mangiferae]
MTIHQFGRFRNKSIRLPHTPMIMIYGENESGKSTIMAFILNQLFGFPSKKNLEKWSGTAGSDGLGGLLTFVADNGIRYQIERSFGREERLHVIGEARKAESLHELLRGMNRMLFEHVFCFDLDGLRDIDKMDPDDLNDLLLGAGMIGSGTLGHLEQTLEKHCADLFKKSGKNPEINQLLGALNKNASERKEWERKLDQYQELQDAMEAGRKRIEELEQEKKIVQQKFHEWTAYKAARPLIRTYQSLQHELRAFKSDAPFPQNGKERYEDVQKRLSSYRTECAELDEQIKQLDESRSVIRVDMQWRTHEAAIQRLDREASVHQQYVQEEQRIEEEEARLQSECRRAVAQLGGDWTIERIQHVSPELSIRRQLKEKLSEWKGLLEDRRALARDLKAALNWHEQLNQQAEKMKAVDPGERKRSEKRKRSFASLRQTFAFIVLTIVLSALSSAWIAPLAGIPVAILGMAAMIGIFFLMQKRPEADARANTAASGDMERLSAEQGLLEQQLNAADMEILRLKKRQETCSRLCEEKEAAIINWLNSCGFIVSDLTEVEAKVHLVDETQEKCRLLEQIVIRKRKLKERIRRFETETRSLAAELGISGGDAHYLAQRCHEEIERIRRREEMDHQRHIYQKQKDRYLALISALEHDQTGLFRAAQVTDEEQFYAAAEKNEHRITLKKQLATTRKQLLELTGSEEQIAAYSAYLNKRQWEEESEPEFRDQIAQCDAELKSVRNQLADDQAKCLALESSHSYRDLLDDYHVLLEEVNRKAKEWAVYQTAFWAIQKAKEHYRKKRLPRVLSEAARYLCLVTDGRYTDVRIDRDGFHVEDATGRVFRAFELSRGTAEQLYLSLRLALMREFSGYETMPVIIDDGLVNFDRQRSERVYALLEKIAEERQVIILTCHDSPYLREHPESVFHLDMEESMHS